MTTLGANHVLTLGESDRTGRRYHVGIASVLRRCGKVGIGRLTGRSEGSGLKPDLWSVW